MFVKFAVLAVAMHLPTVMVWGQPSQPSSPAQSQPIAYSAVDLEVRESVFRELLRSQSRGCVCFISFGPDEKSIWVEPSAHFLERLADLKLELKPVSGARFPTRSDCLFSLEAGKMVPLDSHPVELQERPDEPHSPNWAF